MRQTGVGDMRACDVELRKIWQSLEPRSPTSVTPVPLRLRTERFLRPLRCSSPASVNLL